MKCYCDVLKFVVIVYGKLGGKEFGYVLDFDLIFLYDDLDECVVDVYIIFMWCLIIWFMMVIGVGVLFDIDLWLWLNGEVGLFVIDFDVFCCY